MLINQGGFTNHLLKTLINIEMSREIILKNLLLSVINSFMTEVPIICKKVYWFVQNSIAKY